MFDSVNQASLHKDLSNQIDQRPAFLRKIFSLKDNHFLQSLIFIAVLFFMIHPPAKANDDEIMARLDAIQALSDRNNEEGLRQLIEFKKNLPADASPNARLLTLRVLYSLYFDAGKGKLGNETVEEYKQLAQRLKDKNASLLIQIFDAYDIYEKSGQDAAFAYLESIRETVSSAKNVEASYRYSGTLAGFYSAVGRFDEAMSLYFEMLKMAENLPRRQMQAKLRTWGLISGLYLSMKDPNKALELTQEAMVISSDVAPKAFLDILNSRGYALSLLKRNEEALKEFETALKIAKQENLPSMMGLALINIADQNLIRKDFKKAEELSREAMEIYKGIDEKWGVMGAQVNLGFALGGQGKMKQGIELVNESLAFYKKNDSKLDVELVTGEFAQMYESAGMYKEAVTLMREREKLSDELFQSDRTKAVASLQEQFNAEQRKKQIELLAKDNALKDSDIKNSRLQQMVALLASLVAVLGGSFIFMLYRRSKKLNEQLQEMNTQLEFHAVRDPLTGLHNRRSFIALMSTRMGRVDVERREGSYGNPDCMILMDIDHFKHINDNFGHAVGDIVLKEVSQRLRNVVREDDMLMRWGGEEFLIFSPKSNPEQITSLVERVLRTIGDTPFIAGNHTINVTVTAGFISVPFSEVPEDICDWEKALQIADMALYLGKTHGRNRAYGLSRLLVPHEEAITTLTHDLAAAITNKMVEVFEVLGPTQNSQ
jgi:diguanylate cyclase (GGDEF)-like protein